MTSSILSLRQVFRELSFGVVIDAIHVDRSASQTVADGIIQPKKLVIILDTPNLIGISRKNKVSYSTESSD